jgi:hypothetical protein
MVIHREAASPKGIGEVMAKGNMGNLAQHFVALEVARKVVTMWGQPSIPVEFIDCYSMGTWEAIEQSQTPQRRLFDTHCSSFRNGEGGFVGGVFHQAWISRHGRRLPTNTADLLYPNTAFLLSTAFPTQRFKMRLHDVVHDNYQQLIKFARSTGPEFVRIGKDWTQSALIHSNPAPADKPVLVMLDPYRIVPADHDKSNEDGYLNPRLLKYLLGLSGLAIAPAKRTAPCVVVLCSYSEQHPESTFQLMQEIFIQDGWNFESLLAGPYPDVGNVKSHVIGVASIGVPVPILGSSLMQKWTEWNSTMGGAP